MARAVEALILELEAKGSVVDGRARRATDEYTGSVGRSSRATNTASRSQRGYERATRQTSRSVSGLQRQLVGLAAAWISVHGAISAVRSTVDVFATYEAQMDTVLAVTRASAEEFDRLNATARELGASTRFSATEAGSGMEFLARAGFNANEVVAAMPGLLDLATAGAVDLGLAADIASNILSGFGLQASETNRVADVMAETTAASNTNIQQLGDAMKLVAPVAAAMGLSVEDAAGAIGVLSNAGLQGSMAGTGLRRVLSGLANPTGEAATAIQGLGLSLDQVNPLTNNFTTVVQRLADAGLGATEALTIFGDRGGPAILALTGAAPQVAELTQQIEGAEGSAAAMAKTMNDNFAGSVKAAQSALQEWALTAGQEFMPRLREMVEGFAQWLRENRELAQTFGRTMVALIDLMDDLAKVVALLMGYKLAVWIGTATQAMLSFNVAVAANPLGLLVTGIAAAVLGLGALFDALERADEQFTNVIELVNKANNQPILFKGTSEEIQKSVDDTKALVRELTELRDSGKLTEGQMDHVQQSIAMLNTNLETYTDWKLKQTRAEETALAAQIQSLSLSDALSSSTIQHAAATEQSARNLEAEIAALEGGIALHTKLRDVLLGAADARAEANREWEEFMQMMEDLDLGILQNLEVPDIPPPPLDEWAIADEQLIEIAEKLSDDGTIDADKIAAQTEKWIGKLFEVADAFALIGGEMDGILGQIAQGIEQAARMVSTIRQQGGGGKAQALGAVGGFLSGSNIFGGDGGNYGAEFSSLGSMFGPWGTAIGGVIGSFVKKGLDQATATVTRDLTDAAGDASLLGPVQQAGDAVRATLQSIADSIGADLGEFNVGIKQRGDQVTVFIKGIEQTFSDMGQAVDFLVTELAKTEGVLSGASAEVQAALANTAATTVEELQRDLAIAIESRAQKVGDFQSGIEQAVDGYIDLVEEELRLGLVNAEGSGGITGLTRHFGELRDQLLGIERPLQERMAQERETFDLQVLMARARLESMKAEILSSQAVANTEQAVRQFQIESTSEWGRHAIETSAAVSDAAAAAAASSMAALDAINAALNSEALRTITDQEFQDALDRIGRAGGGRNRRREREEQAARDLERLADILDAADEIIQAAGESDIETAFRHLGERYADLFSEAADLAAAKAAAEGITLREALDDILGTLGDAFGIEALELFRDEFERLQAAGDVEGIRDLIEMMNQITDDLPPELADAFDSILEDWRALLDDMEDEITSRDPRPLGPPGTDLGGGVDLDPRTRDRLEETLQGLRDKYDDLITGGDSFGDSLAELQSDFDRMRGLTRRLTDDTDDLSAALADLSSQEQRATQALGIDFLNSLNNLGAVSPELAAIQQQLAVHQLELARATAIADAIALAAAGAFQGLGISLAQIIQAINSSVDAAIAGAGANNNVTTSYNNTSAAANRLSSVLDRVQDQIDNWRNIGVDPLRSTLDGMIDTFVNLRREVLEAGGSISDVTELQAALGEAMERVWQEQLDRVRDFINDPAAAQAGLRREDQLGVLQGSFDQALAAVLANPSQGGIDSLLAAAEALRSFGLENFDGASLQSFLALINGQLAGVLDLELPEQEIPPVGEINQTVQQTLPQIAQGIQDALQLQQQTLLELLDQSPLLEQQLGISADQIRDISEMLGIQADQLAEFIEVNPNLATLIAEIGDQFPLLSDLTGKSGEQLLELLKLDPSIAELVGVSVDTRTNAEQQLDTLDLINSAIVTQTDQQQVRSDQLIGAINVLATAVSQTNASTNSLVSAIDVRLAQMNERLDRIATELDELGEAVDQLADSGTAGGTG